MDCDVGAPILANPDDLMASVCMHLAELAMGERERVFPPTRRPGDMTRMEVTDLSLCPFGNRPAPINAHPTPALLPHYMDQQWATCFSLGNW